jgi:tRNA (adenine57-N1/adenine58-N1)-methyltransferase
MCGFLLPTTNQVSDLLRGLDEGPFVETEVLEILVRRYKPVADRLRPDDRMVAHTGFLIFTRYMEKPEPLLLPETDASEVDPTEDEEEALDPREDEASPLS